MKVFRENEENQDSLLKAVNLLDQAILIDSNYYMAYSNKATLLCYLNKNIEAINTLDKILAINPNLDELNTFKGFLLEKSGDSSKALETYKNVLAQYEKRLTTDSLNVSIMLNKAFLYFFTDGYDRGVKEFEIISSRFPKNTEVENMRNVFVSFNRQAFIDSICLK